MKRVIQILACPMIAGVFVAEVWLHYGSGAGLLAFTASSFMALDRLVDP